MIWTNLKKDGFFAWFVCMAGFIFWLCTFGFVFSLGVIFSELLKEFGESRSTTSLVITVIPTLVLTTAPLAFFFGRKFGEVRVVCIGGLLMVTSLLSSSLVTSITQMVCTFGILYGLGSACLIPFIFRGISAAFSKRIGTALGLSSVGSAIGPLIFAPSLSTMMKLFGWRITFRVMAAVIGSSLFWGVLGFSLKSRFEGEKDEAHYNVRMFVKRELVVLREPKAMLVILSRSLIELQITVMYTHQVQLAIEYGVNREKAALLPTYMGAGGLIGRIVSGFIFDIKFMKALHLYQLIIFLSGVIGFLGLLSKTFAHFVMYFTALNFLAGVYQPQLFTVLASILGYGVVHESFQLLMFCTGLTSMIGPSVLGRIVDQTKNYSAIFYMIGIPCLVASLLLFGYKCTKKGDQLILEEEHLPDTKDVTDTYDDKNWPLIVRETCL